MTNKVKAIVFDWGDRTRRNATVTCWEEGETVVRCFAQWKLTQGWRLVDDEPFTISRIKKFIEGGDGDE